MKEIDDLADFLTEGKSAQEIQKLIDETEKAHNILENSVDFGFDPDGRDAFYRTCIRSLQIIALKKIHLKRITLTP